MSFHFFSFGTISTQGHILLQTSSWFQVNPGMYKPEKFSPADHLLGGAVGNQWSCSSGFNRQDCNRPRR